MVYKVLKTFFSCRKCGEILSEPILLECEDLFCLNCLNKYKKNLEIKCPFCNKSSYREIKENLNVKLLVQKLLSMNDEDFLNNYSNFLSFVSKYQSHTFNFGRLLLLFEQGEKKLKIMSTLTDTCKVKLHLKKRKFCEVISQDIFS